MSFFFFFLFLQKTLCSSLLTACCKALHPFSLLFLVRDIEQQLTLPWGRHNKVGWFYWIPAADPRILRKSNVWMTLSIQQCVNANWHPHRSSPPQLFYFLSLQTLTSAELRVCAVKSSNWKRHTHSQFSLGKKNKTCEDGHRSDSINNLSIFSYEANFFTNY